MQLPRFILDLNGGREVAAATLILNLNGGWEVQLPRLFGGREAQLPRLS